MYCVIDKPERFWDNTLKNQDAKEHQASCSDLVKAFRVNLKAC